MRHGHAVLIAVFCAAMCAAETPVRPVGNEWPPIPAMFTWKVDGPEPEGYKSFLNLAAAHSPYTMFTTTLRTEIIEEEKSK